MNKWQNQHWNYDIFFGVLQASSVNNSNSVESTLLLEVFKIFLSTDNTLVFAALDCILFLKYVRDIDNNKKKNKTLHGKSLKYLLSSNNILIDVSNASLSDLPLCSKDSSVYDPVIGIQYN